MKINLGIKRKVIDLINAPKVIGRKKIFGIGYNKTGTTSLNQAMVDLGFVVGNQRQGEILFDDWLKRDFRKLISFCRTAQFFQDAPFSYPYTFVAMDQAFPGSKFILTIRDNPEQWYNSLIKFHGKLWGNGNVPPSAEDLKNANYLYKGFPYYSKKKRFKVDDTDLYNKDILISDYLRHNENVVDYFGDRPNDLLVINIAEKDSYQKFLEFLNVESNVSDFPWENKT